MRKNELELLFFAIRDPGKKMIMYKENRGGSKPLGNRGGSKKGPPQKNANWIRNVRSIYVFLEIVLPRSHYNCR